MIWYCLIWCFISDDFDFGEHSIFYLVLFVIWFVEVADATFFCPCFGPQSLPTQTSPFLGIQVLILWNLNQTIRKKHVGEHGKLPIPLAFFTASPMFFLSFRLQFPSSWKLLRMVNGWSRFYNVEDGRASVHCFSMVLKKVLMSETIGWVVDIYEIYILIGGLEHFLLFHILGRIIPTDFHIFQRGRYTTNQ